MISRNRILLIVAVFAFLLIGVGLAVLRSGLFAPVPPGGDSVERRILAPIDDPENAELVAEFKAFLFENEIKHFGAREILTPGGAHRSPTRAGYGLNRMPPRKTWPAMLPTLKVLEKVREEFDAPIDIFSGYRSPVYNSAVGGARRSQHVNFRAFDIAPKSRKAEEVERLYALVKRLRDEEEFFVGGIGKYKAWVHVDTRRRNADW